MMMMKLQVVDSFVVVPSGSLQSYSPRLKGPKGPRRQHFVRGGDQKKLVVLNF